MNWPSPRGQGKEGRPFGELARALLRRKKFAEKGRYSALSAAWRELVGEGVAEHTRITAFREGKLVVEVDSSTLLHELNSFLKDELMTGLQATDAGRDVAQMELRLGAVRKDDDGA